MSEEEIEHQVKIYKTKHKGLEDIKKGIKNKDDIL